MIIAQTQQCNATHLMITNVLHKFNQVILPPSNINQIILPPSTINIICHSLISIHYHNGQMKEQRVTDRKNQFYQNCAD